MVTLSDGTPVVWQACACYVWPMALYGTGRCGMCGEVADYPMMEPFEGKARPLTWAEKRERYEHLSQM